MNGSEDCDDGNSNNNDSCPNDCDTGGGSDYCGDGQVDAGEDCDDGNDVDDDACPNDCDTGG